MNEHPPKVAHEGTPPEKVEQSPRRSAHELLNALLSGESVHGLGRDPFTEEEKKEVDILFSGVNMTFDNPALEQIKGETVLDIVDFLKARPGTPERAAARKRVVDALAQANRDYYIKEV